MKTNILVALLVITVIAQDKIEQQIEKSNIQLPPPVALHESEILDAEAKRENLNGQGFDNRVDPIIQNGHPLLGREQFNMPPPHQPNPEFNPPFDHAKPQFKRPQHGPRRRPQHQKQFNHGQMRMQDPFMPMPNNNFAMLNGPIPELPSPPVMGANSQFPHPNGPIPNMPMHNDLRNQFNGPNFMPSQITKNDWERHIEGNHMQGSRSHKKIKCMLIGTAIIFTLFGLCLAKCCRKCRKNRKQQVRALVMRSRSANQILQQIRTEQIKLQQLKNQYALKRNEQARLQQQQSIEMTRQQRQFEYVPMQYYAQPYQVRGYNQQVNQVPVGRPLDQSTNCTNQYPQL